MNKRIVSFCYLLMISAPSLSQELPEAPSMEEHRHHSQEPREVHLTIDIPEQQHSPHTPAEIKKLKLKIAAVTAVITTLITGGITLYISLKSCK